MIFKKIQIYIILILVSYLFVVSAQQPNVFPKLEKTVYHVNEDINIQVNIENPSETRINASFVIFLEIESVERVKLDIYSQERLIESSTSHSEIFKINVDDEGDYFGKILLNYPNKTLISEEEFYFIVSGIPPYINLKTCKEPCETSTQGFLDSETVILGVDTNAEALEGEVIYPQGNKQKLEFFENTAYINSEIRGTHKIIVSGKKDDLITTKTTTFYIVGGNPLNISKTKIAFYVFVGVVLIIFIVGFIFVLKKYVL